MQFDFVRHSGTAFSMFGTFALCVLCLGSSGCNRGPDYQEVSGVVSWQGKPIEKGAITFYPNGDGTAAGCEVVEGKYQIKKEYGPPPGKYRVEIVAYKKTGRTEFDVDLNAKVDISEQYLPKEFNTESKLVAEIVSGKNNVFDFELVPTKK
jgi:hypothetical protein